MHLLEYVIWFFVVVVFMVAVEAHSGIKEAQSKEGLMKPKTTTTTTTENNYDNRRY